MRMLTVALPDLQSRVALIELNLKDINVTQDVGIGELARQTEGYSGADIHLLCREASMQPMRRLIEGRSPLEIQRMRQEGVLASATVSLADFQLAIQNTRPSVSASDLRQFSEWDESFGSR